MQAGDILVNERESNDEDVQFFRVDAVDGDELIAQPIGCDYDHRSDFTGDAIPVSHRPLNRPAVRARWSDGKAFLPTLQANRMDRPYMGAGITW